jgi:hypothetical protein
MRAPKSTWVKSDALSSGTPSLLTPYYSCGALPGGMTHHFMIPVEALPRNEGSLSRQRLMRMTTIESMMIASDS